MAEPAPQTPQSSREREQNEQSERSYSYAALAVGLIAVAGLVAIVWGGITLWSLWFR